MRLADVEESQQSAVSPPTMRPIEAASSAGSFTFRIAYEPPAIAPTTTTTGARPGSVEPEHGGDRHRGGER